MAKTAAKPRKKVGYQMPDPLPLGLVVEDLAKQRWKLGPSIGKGGFGEIYSAQKVTEGAKAKYSYVVKIEPHNNGPLFVEMHFYMRNTKSEDLEQFKSSHKLKSLGIPEYIGAGSHQHAGEKYRFVVMRKFSTDLWKIFLDNNRSLPETTAFQIAIQIVDALEYIHSRQYVHADIKGQNILLDDVQENQVYLVDFGLCTKYATEYKPDPKKAHDGTIEYVSRDGHLGIPSRRGDLEILGYNLIHWLGGELPWEKLKKPTEVQASKEKHMSHLNDFLKACFGTKKPKDALHYYLKYVAELKCDVDPDYAKIRKILAVGVGKVGTPLKLKVAKQTTKLPTPTKVPKKLKSKTGKKAANVSNDEEKPVEDDTTGYTAEMLLIKKRLDAKKSSTKSKKSAKENLMPNGDGTQDASTSAPARELRRKHPVNYTEGADEVPKKINKKREK